MSIYIYFSPHLDDVSLLCGGRIAGQTTTGQGVLVVTIFAYSQPNSAQTPQAFPHLLDIDDRQQDDLSALQVLAADRLWLDYQDAIQRHPRYTSIIGITDPIPRWETSLYPSGKFHSRNKSTLARCRALLSVGAGNHIVHQLVSATGL